ncbi:MAG: hypothetical protein WD691_02870 [Acidimicrobiales bacterium]
MLGTQGLRLEDPGTLGGSALASWTPLVALLAAFAVVVLGLIVRGRTNPSWGGLRVLSRAPDSLTRLTGVPGWAAVAIGTSLFGLLVAGQGFYSDVAWHIALGRDDELFTAPHASILLGLVLILAGAVLGTLTATLDQVPDTLRLGGLRVPRSLLPLWALSLGAVSGFPIDELWHQAYGVDVTMWSPTHMLMILGATFTGLAVWLVLADSGVAPTTSRWGRGLHVLCAWLTLQGLVAPLGEFSFGVPQFRLLFAPVLVCLAGGLALTAMRVVLGPGWTLGIASVSFLLMGGGGDSGPVETRHVGTFIASAAAVELIALLIGIDRRLRFAVASGVAVGTVGLAGEWWWNQDAFQPWTSSLLPEVVVLGIVVSVAAAVVGARYVEAIAPRDDQSEAVSGRLVAAAAAVCVVTILALLPRGTGEVTADIRYESAGAGRVLVEATLNPPDAADGAHWFQISAWQGGGLDLADMEPTGRLGTYRSEGSVPVDGHWKTLLRLHRDGEMMALPLFLPADPTIGATEITPTDRTLAFAGERRYLLRETHDGNAWLSPLVHGFLVVTCSLWALAFVVAVRSLGSGRSSPVLPQERLRG